MFNKERDNSDGDLAAKFNPDGATLSNYRAGRKMPEFDRICLAVSRLISAGTLPAEAFELVHASVGIHRALDPFKGVLLELEHGLLPSKHQAETIAKKLKWIEIGQADLDRLLRDDRTDFRQSHLELLDELFAARAHIVGVAVQTEVEYRKNLRWSFRRAQALISAIDRSRVSTVIVVPEYTARALKNIARVGPLMQTSGSLDFGPYIAAWLHEERTESELQKFDSVRKQVLRHCAVDIMPPRDMEGFEFPNSEKLLEIAMVPEFEDIGFIENGTRLRDTACLRRCIRWLGVKWTCTAALMGSIQAYYGVDEPADSDLHEVCCGIAAAARELANSKPAEVSLLSVKRLIKLVHRLSIDVWASMNLDVADAVPLDKQPWRYRDPLALP